MHYYLITGTSRGLGRALVEHLVATDNCTVIGIARHATIAHPRYQHQALDLADLAGLAQHLPKMLLPFADATSLTLINNAGVLGDIGYVGQLRPEHFTWVYHVNVLAPALLMNAFLAAYAQRGIPLTILNISSGAARRPIDGWAAYCSSKAALEMLTLTTAAEQALLGHHHVRLHALSPGVIDTPMQAQIRAADVTAFSQADQFRKRYANGELAGAGEVARRVVTFLGEPAPGTVLVKLREYTN